MEAHFSETEWVAKLAYLHDMFNLLSELKLSLQWRLTTDNCVQVHRWSGRIPSWAGIMGVMREHADFWDASNIIAEILKETEPRPSFSQRVHASPISAFKEFEHYFPSTEYPRAGKDWICNTFVNKPSESTLAPVEEDQCLRSQMKVVLLKSKQNTEIAIKSTEEPTSVSNIRSSWRRVFYSENQNEITEVMGHKQHALSLPSITPRRDHLLEEKQTQVSYWFCIWVSCILISWFITK